MSELLRSKMNETNSEPRVDHRLSCFLGLPRQSRWIFMHALAEVTAHARRQTDTGFSELVAQAVGGSQSVFPTLLAVAVKQIDLIGLRGERRCMDAQQSHLYAFLPILAEERADMLEDFGVELCWAGQGVSACDGREIFVAQF